MVYTIFRFVLRWIFRIYVFFLTLHFVHSIYQATFLTPAHNRGQIIDHGAEILQNVFKDLRVYHLHLNHLVKTVNQVFLQFMLTITLWYKDLSVAFAVIASLVVVAKLVVWVTSKVQELVSQVYSATAQFLQQSRAALKDNFRWAGELFWDGEQTKRSFHTDTYARFTESSNGSSETPRRTADGRVWKQTTTPVDDDGSHADKEDSGSATDKKERTSEPDCENPPSTDRASKRAHSAPPRSAETSPDQDDRHNTEKTKKDQQHTYGDADSGREKRNETSWIWVSHGTRTEAMTRAQEQATEDSVQAAKEREQAALRRQQEAQKREQERDQVEKKREQAAKKREQEREQAEKRRAEAWDLADKKRQQQKDQAEKEREQAARQREQEREQAARQREQEREQAERRRAEERDLAEKRRQRERDQAEKAREQAAKKREQEREQAEKKREQERAQAEKEREQAREQAAKRWDQEMEERWQAAQARLEQAEVTEPTESISFSEYNDTSRIKTSLRCVYGGKIYKCSISDEYVEVLWDGEQIVLPTLGKPTDFGMRSTDSK